MSPVLPVVFFIRPAQTGYRRVEEAVERAVSEAGAAMLTFDDQLVDASESREEALLRPVKAATAVVADVTDADSNILFELGLASGLGKPIVVIAQNAESLTAEVASSAIIVYEPTTRGLAELSLRLSRLLPDALRDVVKFRSDAVRIRERTVFISYSHQDRRFLERLVVHLKPLEKDGRLTVFSDQNIKAGEKWRDEIGKALDRARVAILLISADFLASDFIVDDELPPLLKKAESGGTRILAVLVKASRFARDPKLREFQAINQPSKPLVEMTEGEQERTYDEIARVVEEALPSK
jgi:nucleoside 2-deoxyribosyltransferase